MLKWIYISMCCEHVSEQKKEENVKTLCNIKLTPPTSFAPSQRERERKGERERAILLRSMLCRIVYQQHPEVLPLWRRYCCLSAETSTVLSEVTVTGHLLSTCRLCNNSASHSEQYEHQSEHYIDKEKKYYCKLQMTALPVNLNKN